MAIPSGYYANKVTKADGTTLIDLTGDTVAANVLRTGYTAHGADGAPITGTYEGVALPDLDALTFGTEGQETFEGKTDGRWYQEIAEAINIRAAIGLKQMQFFVNAPAGVTVTAEKDGITYAGTELEDQPGTYIVYGNGRGTYHVTVTSGDYSFTRSITVEPQSVEMQPPEGYTMLQWIETTRSGPAVWSIGVVDVYPNAADITKFIGRLAFTDLTEDSQTGVNTRIVYTTDNWQIELRCYLDAARGKIGIGYSGYDGAHTGTATEIEADTDFHTFQFEKGAQSIDGAAVGTLDASNFGTISSGAEFKLFGYQPSDIGSYSHTQKMKIAWFDIYDSTGLARQLVAARRDSNNALGMYDMVSGTFYRNASYTAGPEV